MIRTIESVLERAAKRRQMRAGSSELADNAVVTLRGIVEPLAEPLVAPLSGKPCVAFVAHARMFYSGRNRKRLGQPPAYVHVETQMVPFALVTSSAKVVVDDSSCVLILPVTPVIPRSRAHEQALVERAELSQFSDISSAEARVAPGMQILVQGIVRHELDESAGGETCFREAPTRIRLTGDDAHPLMIARP